MMDRRSFLQAGLLAGGTIAAGNFSPLCAKTKKASDLIRLGPDKVKLSRLAIGTGTIGGTIQRALGLQGVADMLQDGFDRGVFFWDTADSYHTHPHVKEALKGKSPPAHKDERPYRRRDARRP